MVCYQNTMSKMQSNSFQFRFLLTVDILDSCGITSCGFLVAALAYYDRLV
jgi:hypothetical protein